MEKYYSTKINLEFDALFLKPISTNERQIIIAKIKKISNKQFFSKIHVMSQMFPKFGTKFI